MHGYKAPDLTFDPHLPSIYPIHLSSLRSSMFPNSDAHHDFLPLVVAQYQLYGQIRTPTPTHWAIVALTTIQHAHIFELTGDPSAYAYSTRVITNYHASRELRGGYHVGAIPADKLAWMRDKLRDVAVVQNSDDHHCQTWVIEALQLLKEEGIITVTTNIGYGHIRKEMAAEMERWDTGEDTVEERLFAQ